MGGKDLAFATPFVTVVKPQHRSPSEITMRPKSGFPTSEDSKGANYAVIKRDQDDKDGKGK